MTTVDISPVTPVTVPGRTKKQSLALRATNWLSVAILLLAALASAGGLLIDGLYRDIPKYQAAWLSNDVVTLFVVLPLYVVALYYRFSGSLRATLGLLGLQAYMLYNYAFYLFGAEFNAFFLLYVLLLVASIYALAIGVGSLNMQTLSQKVSYRMPTKWVSGFLLLISLPLIMVEGGQAIGFILTGKLPEAPSLIFALDLTLVVPSSILAAILLWKGNVWGYLLGTMMSIKGFTYGLVLVTMTVYAKVTMGIGWDPLLPFYAFVALGGLFCSLYLVRTVQEEH